MWRSFFFAVGIFLFVAGLQCLVVEQFFIDQNNRILTLAKKAGNAAKSNGQEGLLQLTGQPSATPDQRNLSLPSSYYGGPSRFQSPRYSPQSRVNGLPAGYAAPNSPNSAVNDSALQNSVKRLTSHPINDWVPWCLLAVGTIVCLYTKSLAQPRYGND